MTPRTDPPRPRTQVHPLAWWVWAGGAAVALTRVGNPLVLVLLIGAVVLTAAVCREASSGSGAGARGGWRRTLEAALVLGAVIVLVRTGFYVLVGFPDSTRVLLDLPSIDLPWFTNLHVLGPVHFGGLVQAVIEGVRLAGLVIVFGAAAAVSNPRRALRHLPSSLHHLGTAAVIAVAAAPQLVASVGRIRRAQRLRAPGSGSGKRSKLRALAATLIPVLAGALDQSLTLAGSMDSRGYSRAHTRPRGVGAALVVALLAAAAGTYGLLDTMTPTSLSLGLLTGGFALAAGASIVASRAVQRTRYLPAPWGWADTLIAGAGTLTAAGALAAPALATSILGNSALGNSTLGNSALGSAALTGSWRAADPWPTLPVLGGVIVAALVLPILTEITLPVRVSLPAAPPQARPEQLSSAAGSTGAIALTLAKERMLSETPGLTEVPGVPDVPARAEIPPLARGPASPAGPRAEAAPAGTDLAERAP